MSILLVLLSQRLRCINVLKLDSLFHPDKMNGIKYFVSWDHDSVSTGAIWHLGGDCVA